jgi:hypothetical protein
LRTGERLQADHPQTDDLAQHVARTVLEQEDRP